MFCRPGPVDGAASGPGPQNQKLLRTAVQHGRSPTEDSGTVVQPQKGETASDERNVNIQCSSSHQEGELVDRANIRGPGQSSLPRAVVLGRIRHRNFTATH